MQNVILDDWDPTISYSGNGWYIAGSAEEWNSTTHGTNTAGTGFSVTFNGTSISVYGTIGANYTGPTRSSYILENVTTVYDANSGPTTQYHQQFYSSPKLPQGLHTLTVSVDAAGYAQTYYLDYIIYTNALGAASAVNTTMTPSNSNHDAGLGVLIPAIVISICSVLIFVLVSVWWLVRKPVRNDKPRIRSITPMSRTEHMEYRPHPRAPSTGAEPARDRSLGEDDRFIEAASNAAGIWAYNAHHQAQPAVGAASHHDRIDRTRQGLSAFIPPAPAFITREKSSNNARESVLASEMPPSYTTSY